MNHRIIERTLRKMGVTPLIRTPTGYVLLYVTLSCMRTQSNEKKLSEVSPMLDRVDMKL